MIFKYIYTFLFLFLFPLSLWAQKTNSKTVVTTPIVQRVGEAHTLHNALNDRHIALWNSHGRYYNQEKGMWMWQRACLMGTVEDLHTTDYILNYILPMLENAGAEVYLPRERDYNSTEYIIDNDSPSHYYTEQGEWNNGRGKGFAHTREVYDDFTNPFTQGTYRWCKSSKGHPTATATWQIDVEKSGSYAVYVSYSIVKNGATDAHYTIYHAGGATQYLVNQTMGGGTWIYLGTFDFVKGENNRVELSNLSQKEGAYITADAIKVGGGMGNIARKPCVKPRKATKQALNTQKAEARKKRKKKKKVTKAQVEVATTSGMPRYAEGARYWMQWAGVPDTIFSDTGGDDDYADDLRGRAYWVNYLCGGSHILPDSNGLHIPIDVALSFHSDAGNVEGDSIIGTMGIFYTGQKKRRDLRFANKVSRKESETLYECIEQKIAQDLQGNKVPNWNIRKPRNRRYAEARLLDVPCLLLESMSHQNFTDMQYGLDPRFKFDMSRAIYKGILQYLAKRNHTPYVVQPLPVTHMAIEWHGKDKVKLSWKESVAPLDETATPTAYKVYTQQGDYGWDNGTVVSSNYCIIPIEDEVVYSFYVTALNDGGESFPSEILSACCKGNKAETIMIINAFDRVSAPLAFSDTASHTAGFLYELDGGVPYRYTAAYTGAQYNFNRDAEWVDDLIDPGYGASYRDYESQLIAGNTFDYPHRHGTILSQLGYSFLSASDEAVSDSCINLSCYPYLDVIMGKERATIYGCDSTRYDFEALPIALANALTQYCKNGGHMLISGAYIGQDAYDGALASPHAQQFINEILHCEWLSARSAHDASAITTIMPGDNRLLTWKSKPNSNCYAVEQSDILYPTDNHAVTFLQYPDGSSAGVACKTSQYRCCTLGVPIEAIESAEDQKMLFQVIFDFLNHKP